jgi:glycosyltransferase involved in cell wall biosynthesis
MYCEFYYQSEGADVGFDPEFISEDPGYVCRLGLKNINNLIHFQVADAGLSPTHWQASTFPQEFRDRITVIHDGIDTEVLTPLPSDMNLSLKLNNEITLTRQNEIITFVNRNLEPYRGYHIFMRCLPELLKKRPNVYVLIVGGDEVSYGSAPQGNTTWKELFAREVRPQISDEDWSRVHFLGKLPYDHFISILQLSTVHLYLTYPFVLSWSLLEAMSLGCTIVASDTKPLHEVIQPNETGRLVDFFDREAIVREVCLLLDQPNDRLRLGLNARNFVRQNYDLKTVCLPKQLEWVLNLGSDPKRS